MPSFNRSLAAAALFSITAFAGGAAAQEGAACVGRDLIGDIRAADPKAFERITADGNAIENAKGLLWKLEHPEYPNRIPSYLFGTMHVSDDRLAKLSPAVENALSNSRRIALEVESTSSDRLQEAFGAMQAEMALPKSQGLEKMLSAAELARLTDIVKQSGLPAEVTARLRPWVLTMLMSTSECQIKRIRSGKNALDGELAAIAENRGMGTFGLESLEMQFQTLASIPDADQLSILKATLKGYDKMDDYTETMLQLYLKRDLGKIWPLQVALAERNGASKTAFDTFGESMIMSRNVRMRDRAMMHIAYGGVFIAVGALHLPGKKGLVELFREAGYNVTLVE